MKSTLVTAETGAAGAGSSKKVSLGPCMKTGRQGVVEGEGAARLLCTEEGHLHRVLLKLRQGTYSSGKEVASWVSVKTSLGALRKKQTGQGLWLIPRAVKHPRVGKGLTGRILLPEMLGRQERQI